MKKKKVFYLFAASLLIGVLGTYVGQLTIFPFVYDRTLLTTLWSRQLKRTIQDISVVQNQSIIAVMSDSVASLNLETGKLNWVSQLPSKSLPYPASIGNSTAFILTTDSIMALDIHDGTILWQQPSYSSHAKILGVNDKIIIVNYLSNSIKAYAVASGKLLWSLPISRGYVTAYIQGAVIYEIDSDLKALDMQTGELIWETKIDIRGNSSFSNGILVYEGGSLFASKPVYIVTFDVDKRKELWRTLLDIDGPSRFLVNDEYLFISDHNRIYAMLRSNGSLLWTTVSSSPTNMTMIKKNPLVLDGFERTVSTFDFVTGTKRDLLQVDLPQLLITEKQDLVAVENTIVFSRGKTVYAYSYKD